MNSTGPVLDFGFSDSNTGYFPAENGSIYKTINGGVNWFEQNSGYAADLFGISVISSDIITVAGVNGNIYRTINGGVNWHLQTAPVTTNLRSVFFLNANIGYIVGSNGVILKTGDGGWTYLHQISNEIPKEFLLEQNYPNPFNPVTNIKFQIPKSGFVMLTIYDELGREIKQLVSQQLIAGSYSADWKAANYPSGIYFYKIETEDFAETKRMVLLK